MESNKTCTILEQYLGYLLTIKGHSECTIKEYRTDNLHFFAYIMSVRNAPLSRLDFAFADINFIKSITLADMYSYITYCQDKLKSCAGTRARKIVSIRQFWKYLKTKVHVIDDNIAEALETPKLPIRIPQYLTLEESVRLLIASAASPRDHCILTIFLNCALRVSELVALNIDQVSNDIISVIGKGNKERKIFLTPAVKKAVSDWMQLRSRKGYSTNALFISRNKRRLTTHSVRNIVKKYVSLAGIGSKNISPQKLRHTSATLMYKYGKVDIRALQQILGHESIATTEIYTHIDESQLQSAVNSNPLAIMFN